jgi:RNA polymerase sigma factor (sigma-70 family)
MELMIAFLPAVLISLTVFSSLNESYFYRQNPKCNHRIFFPPEFSEDVSGTETRSGSTLRDELSGVRQVTSPGRAQQLIFQPIRISNMKRKKSSVNTSDDGVLFQVRPGRDVESLTELLVESRRGDQNAFAKVVAAATPWLLAALRRCEQTAVLCADPGAAEDVLQETFLKSWLARNRYDPLRGGIGWLWTIAKRSALDALRRRRRAPRSLFGREGKLIQEPVTLASPGAEDLERREELDTFRNVLAQRLRNSPPRVRKAWRLRHCEGRPYAEVARTLGVPVGTVATWLHRLKLDARADHAHLPAFC